jgi:hypothetical protein
MTQNRREALHFAFRIPCERLKEFKGISAEEKLRWLEEARDFVAKSVPPEKLALWRRLARLERSG